LIRESSAVQFLPLILRAIYDEHKAATRKPNMDKRGEASPLMIALGFDSSAFIRVYLRFHSFLR
jgi:hypothetical protein